MTLIASRIESFYNANRRGTAILAGSLLYLALFGMHAALDFSDGLRVLYVLPVWLATRLGGRWAGATLVFFSTILGPYIDSVSAPGQTLVISSLILWAVPLAIVMLVIARVEETLWIWRKKAMHDPLTGLLNRSALHEFGRPALHRAAQMREPLVAVLIDCDDFKVLNDRYGHHAGDRVLQILARVLECETRETDLVARTGGDEFVVLLPNTEEDEARQVMGRVQRAFLCRMEDAGYGTSLSVGMSSMTEEDEASIDQLLVKADQDMYRHKGQKKLGVYLN